MNLECKSCGNVAPSGIRKCPRCKASLVQPSAGAWKLIALLVVFGGLVGLFVAAPALSWCLYVVIAVSGIAAAVGAWKTNPPPACVKVLNLAKRTPKVGWAIAAMVTVASLISLPIAAERSRQHALEERAERDAEARRQEAARVAAEQAAAARAAEQRAVDEVRQRFPAERERIEGVLRTIEQTDLSKSWKDAEAQVASLGMLLEPIRKSPDAGRPEVAATLAKFDAQKERLQAAERERAAVALREDYLGNRARLEKDTKALERLSPARQLPEASDRLAALASGLGKYDSLPESVEGLKVLRQRLARQIERVAGERRHRTVSALPLGAASRQRCLSIHRGSRRSLLPTRLVPFVGHRPREVVLHSAEPWIARSPSWPFQHRVLAAQHAASTVLVCRVAPRRRPEWVLRYMKATTGRRASVSPALSALSPPPAPPGGPGLPDDPGRARRLDWATLLARTFGLDALTCPRCQGPMRLIAVIEDPAVARKILEHLGLPARPPPRGRPGWRGQQELAFDEPPEPKLLDPPFDDTDPA